MNDNGDFFEDDEPVQDVISAFEAGEKGTTAMPMVTTQQQPSNGWMVPLPGFELPVVNSPASIDSSRASANA